MLRGIFLSFFLTAIVILAHIIIAHISPQRKLFNLVATIFGASLPGYVLFYWIISPFLFFLSSEQLFQPTVIGFANGLLIHLLLFSNYMACLYYVMRPVSLRILIEFLRAPKQILKSADLQKNYDLKLMIESRLDLLVLHHYASKIGEDYQLTQKGKGFSKILLLLRTLFGVPYYLDRGQRQESINSADFVHR